MKRKGLTVGKVRSFLYQFARFLGDINAILTGHIWRRIRNRIVGKISGRVLWGKIFRK